MAIKLCIPLDRNDYRAGIYCDAGIKRNSRFIIATVTGHSFDCYIIVILIITQDIEIIHSVGAEIQLVSGLVRDKLMIDIYSVV